MADISGPTTGLPGRRLRPMGQCDSCMDKIADRLARECETRYGATSYATERINPFWFNRPHYKALYDAEVAKLPPADVRVQGETDSFGAEYADMCFACQEAAEEAGRKFNEEHGHCDDCHAIGPTIPYRDPDEGSCGPVYEACISCTRERSKREQQEYEDEKARIREELEDAAQYAAEANDLYGF